MSRVAMTRYALLCIVALVLTAPPAFAQQYGQNPAPGGFVPLADGPVPEDTTGTVGTGTNTSLSSGGTNFTLGSNTLASLSPGHLTLTFSNNTSGMGGLYNLFAALGNLDFVFESMTGVDVQVTSLVTATEVVLDFNFSGTATTDSDFNDEPDANPADDTTTTDINTDASPGNPLAN